MAQSLRLNCLTLQLINSSKFSKECTRVVMRECYLKSHYILITESGQNWEVFSCVSEFKAILFLSHF